MLRNGFSLLVLSFVISTAGWADEPVRPQSSEKQQRVSPKLLQDALGLPEYQAQAAELKPLALTLDDLQKLADRLKKANHKEDAELLERFILEQKTRPNQTSLNPTSSGSAQDIRVQVIEVNFDDLAEDSLLRKDDLAATNSEVVAELHRVLKEKKAKLLVHQALLQANSNESLRFSDGGEFPIPVPGGSGTTTIEFREFGLVIEATATPVEKERIRLQLTCGVSAIDSKNAITLNGTTVPGVTKRRVQSTMIMNPNEWICIAGLTSDTNNGDTNKIFFLAKVTPSN